MRPLATALLVALALAPRAFAATAAPACDDGQFAVSGSPLDLGTGADGIDVVNLIAVDGQDGGKSFVVRLAQACQAFAVTQAPRSDAFVLRAKFRDCGDHPRFRLRLAFSGDCAHVDGRARAAGATIAEFGADRATPPADDGSGDAGGTDPSTSTPPTDGSVRHIATTPAIDSFSPSAAARGQTISIFGTSLDRDANGQRWSGTTPPYFVTFQSIDFGRTKVTPTFVSSTELRVVVPSSAASGQLVLAARTAPGLLGATISTTSERFVVAQPAPPAQAIPVAGQAPATANNGTLHVQASGLSLFNPGDFPVSGGARQIGAFFDANANHVVDVAGGRNDVPYLAFPERTSEFDFSIEQGRGYFQGANAMLWVFFEGGDPNVLDHNDTFFVVHLAIDLAHRTARPIAMIAGQGGDPGIVMSTDQFASGTTITVAQPGDGVGAIRGTISAVPQFLQLVFLPSGITGTCLDPGDLGFCADPGTEFQQNLWANGVSIDFDVPLFADSN